MTPNDGQFDHFARDPRANRRTMMEPEPPPEPAPSNEAPKQEVRPPSTKKPKK